MTDASRKGGGAPATPKERRSAEELRSLLDEGRPLDGASEEATDDASLVDALVSSARPRALEESVHERILERALGLGPQDVEEPPATPIEVQRASALRSALDDTAPRIVDLSVRPLVLMARALKHAHHPAALGELRAEAALRRALALPSLRASRRWIGGGVVTALGVAAALAIMVLRETPPPPESASLSGPTNAFLPGMVEARSTGELFEREDFPPSGGTTERIDRIARARAADQRNNRFVSWGVP